MLIINPGSKVPPGTKQQAIENAIGWLDQMIENGIYNVVLCDSPVPEGERWVFKFKHILTRKTATLSMHGLSQNEVEEYQKGNIFGAMPRVYWNGSSSDEPKLEDFLADGFCIDIVRAK